MALPKKWLSILALLNALLYLSLPTLFPKLTWLSTLFLLPLIALVLIAPRVMVPCLPAILIPKRLFGALALTLVIALFLQLASLFFLPLDRDEKDLGVKLASSTTARLPNPLGTTETFSPNINQYTSIVGSYLTTRVFGVHPWSLRLTSILAGALVILFIAIFARQVVSRFTLLLCLLHFACNALAGWYLGAQKGYVFVLLGSAWLLYLHERWSSHPLLTDGEVLILSFAMLFTIFSHTFGILYVLLWAVAGTSMPRTSPSFKYAVGSTLLWAAPLLTCLLFEHFYYLAEFGDLFQTQAAKFSHALAPLLGLSSSFLLRLCALFLVMLLWMARPQWTLALRLMAWSLGLVFVAILLLDVRVLHARYFLPFLILFPIVVGELVERTPHRTLRGFAALGAILCVGVFPLLSNHRISDMLIQSHRSFHRSMQYAQRALEKHPNACVVWQADPRERRWAEAIYGIQSRDPRCAPTLNVHFLNDAFNRPVARAAPPQDSIKIFQEDHRTLFLSGVRTKHKSLSEREGIRPSQPPQTETHRRSAEANRLSHTERSQTNTSVLIR